MAVNELNSKTFKPRAL